MNITEYRKRYEEELYDNPSFERYFNEWFYEKYLRNMEWYRYNIMKTK